MIDMNEAITSLDPHFNEANGYEARLPRSVASLTFTLHIA
jgi:hypothetical protein